MGPLQRPLRLMTRFGTEGRGNCTGGGGLSLMERFSGNKLGIVVFCDSRYRARRRRLLFYSLYHQQHVLPQTKLGVCKRLHKQYYML